MFKKVSSNRTFPKGVHWNIHVKVPLEVASNSTVESNSGEDFVLAHDSTTHSSEKEVGSITSCCSGKEPMLLPWKHSWTREDSSVSLNQSDNHVQIFGRHKLSHQFRLQPVIIGTRRWIDKCHTKELQRQLRLQLLKSPWEMPERFINGQDVFHF